MKYFNRPIVAIVILIGLASVAPSSYAGTILYKTGFEDPPFVADSPLVGQDDWKGVSSIPLPPSLPPCLVDCLSPNAAVITTDKPRQGKQSVRVSGADLVHQDFINLITDGYYDAIGSYRQALDFDTSGTQRVRLSAHVRVDGPLTPGVNFFSAALTARAAVLDETGEVVDTVGIGQIDLSSDGHVYAHDGNADVPDFQADAPISLGTWHTLAIVEDFGVQTFTLSVDGKTLGTFPFPAGVNSNILVRGTLLAFAAPDTVTMEKASYTAFYDQFFIQAAGKKGGN